MTNRQWLIWRLIDMSDEEFAEGICGNGELWSCDDCLEYEVNGVCGRDCQENFHEWLKEERKEHGKLPAQDKEAVQDLMSFKERYKEG